MRNYKWLIILGTACACFGCEDPAPVTSIAARTCPEGSELNSDGYCECKDMDKNDPCKCFFRVIAFANENEKKREMI